MQIDWLRALRAIGAGFDVAISVSACAFIGYYVAGGRFNQVTTLSIIGLALGALFGLGVAIYSLIRLFRYQEVRDEKERE